MNLEFNFQESPVVFKIEELNESEYVWVHENVDRAKELAKTTLQLADPVLDP